MKKFRGEIGIAITIIGLFMILFSMSSYEGTISEKLFVYDFIAILSIITFLVFIVYGIISIVKH